MMDQKSSAFPHTHHKHMDHLQLCLSVCSSCAKMCIDEGKKEAAKSCLDCADICALTIQLHCRDSALNQNAMQLCAEACNRCSQECAKADAEHCKQCSEICKECCHCCKEGKS